MTAIYRREIKRFFKAPFAAAVCAVLLLCEGLAVMLLNLISGYTSLSPVLTAMQWVLLAALPVIASRSMAEERQKQTDVLLFSLPIRSFDIVLGKYFAVLTLFAAPTALLAFIPLFFSSFGAFSMPNAYIALLGYLLMGATLLAVTLFVSSLTRTRIVAISVNFGVLLALYLLGRAASLLPEPIARLLGATMPFAVFGGFTYGHLDLSGSLCYLTVIALFLFSTVLVLENRRGRKVGHGTKTALTRSKTALSAVLAACILLNLPVALLPDGIKSIDLSGKDTFHISGTTTDYLTALDEDITLTLLCKGGRANADSELYAFLRRYADASPRVTLRVKDPEKDTALRNSIGVDSIEDMSITVESVRRTKLIQNTDLYYYSLYDGSAGKQLTLSPAEYTAMLAYYAEQEDGEAYIAQLTSSVTAQFDGESRVTNAIEFVTAERVGVMYELTALGTTPLESSFTMPPEKGGFDLRTTDTVSVPSDCDILVINTPTQDLTEEGAEALADYLARGGKLLLTTAAGSTAKRLPNLTAILEGYGLGMPQEAGMLCEGASGYLPDATVPYLFDAHINSAHRFTGDFDGECTLLAPHAITVTPTEGITHTDWLYTSKKGYLMNESGEKIGTDAAYTCGAIAETGDTVILWIASAYALTSTANGYSEDGNYTLMHSAITTIADVSINPLAIPPRAMDTATLAPSDTAFLLWSIALVLVIPLASIAVGCAAWYVRKKK